MEEFSKYEYTKNTWEARENMWEERKNMRTASGKV